MPNYALIDVEQASLLEHCAVKAWEKLSAPNVRPTRVVLLNPEDKNSSVYRLEGLGPGGTTVIAKRKRLEALRQELEVYRDILPDVPLRTLRYYGSIDDPDPQLGWLFLEDVGDERYSFHNSEHRVLAAKWLATVHTSVKKVEGESSLPDRGLDYWRHIVELACDAIRPSLGNPAFSTDDLSILHEILSYSQVLMDYWSHIEEICEVMPPTLVHGDFCPKNVRVRFGPQGLELFPIDWDWGGWGMAAVDIAQTDLAAYWSVVRDRTPWLSQESVTRFFNIGRMLWSFEPIIGEADPLASDWVVKVMRKIRFYHAELATAMAAAGWTGQS